MNSMNSVFAPPPAFEVVIPEAVEITNYGFPTASWYDLHLITPGTYPAVYPQGGNLARITLDTTLLKTHRVNRIFNTHSVVETTPDTPSTFVINVHSWEAKEGSEVLSGKGYIKLLDAPTASA